MGKSRKRGGETAHNKRVATRNQAVKGQQNAMQRLFNDAMKAQIETMKEKAEAESATTVNQ
jgi:hypothetical protein